MISLYFLLNGFCHAFLISFEISVVFISIAFKLFSAQSGKGENDRNLIHQNNIYVSKD